MNLSWRNTHKQLKKVVYGINEHNLRKLISEHEARGWSQCSEIKKYGYGYGCLMKYNKMIGEFK